MSDLKRNNSKLYVEGEDRSVLSDMYDNLTMMGLLGDSMSINGGGEHLIGLGVYRKLGKISDVSVGDIAVTGNRQGYVTQLTEDGDTLVNIRVVETLPAIISGDSDITSRTVDYTIDRTDERAVRVDGGVASGVTVGNMLIYRVGGNNITDALEISGFVSSAPVYTGNVVSGFVFTDVNESGAYSGIPIDLYQGAVVNLHDQSDDSVVSSTVTGSDGTYSFDNLNAGNYYLVFELPSGFSSFSSFDNAPDDIDSDVDNNGTSQPFNVGVADTEIEITVGIVQ